VDYLKNFVIPFSGLKIGNHHFSFKIDDKFFEQFQYSEISKGNLQVNCTLDKQSRMMILNFSMKGKVRVTCDRCADEFDQLLEGNQKLIIKFGEDQAEESDEIIVLAEKDHELYIGQYLYEYIHLLLPIKKVHKTDKNGKSMCNPDVVKYITEVEDKAADPRWEVLQQLMERSNENDN
jgi:uncharacterized metal-binding protein YceD (DUF177 family)